MMDLYLLDFLTKSKAFNLTPCHFLSTEIEIVRFTLPSFHRRISRGQWSIACYKILSKGRKR